MRVITTNSLPRLFRLTGRQQQWSRSICLSPVTWQGNRNQKDTKGQSPIDLTSAAVIGIGVTAGFSFWHQRNKLLAKELTVDDDDQILETAGKYRDGLPEYRKSEVAPHDDETKSIWVTYQHGVYDITDFVEKHPGAKNILMAAGGSIEPFWNMYAVHKGSAQVYALLEEYRIGNLNI